MDKKQPEQKPNHSFSGHLRPFPARQRVACQRRGCARVIYHHRDIIATPTDPSNVQQTPVSESVALSLCVFLSLSLSLSLSLYPPPFNVV